MTTAEFITITDMFNYILSLGGGGVVILLISIISFALFFITRYREMEDRLILIGALNFILIGFLVVIEWIDIAYIMIPVLLLSTGVFLKIVQR